jgi:aspartate-semialdehyde dehydrogenase
VVGATGQVGVAMRQILLERGFPVEEVRFFASSRSAGTVLPFGDRQGHGRGLRTADPSGLDIAVFSAGATASRALAPRFADAGVVVVDNSPRGAWTRRARWWSSEVNPDTHRPGAPAADHRQPELHHDGRDAGAQAAARRGRAGPAGRVDVPGGLGSGVAGVDELADQVAAAGDKARELAYDGEAIDFPAPVKYARTIAYNVLPLAGSIVDDGLDETDEEQKLRNETRKILGIPTSGVRASACGCRCSRATRWRSTPSSSGR